MKSKSDYIKREDAIEALDKVTYEGVPLPLGFWNNALKDVPSAEVAEVGTWYKFDKDYAIECETNEYGYNAFKIMKAAGDGTFLKIYKERVDKCGEWIYLGGRKYQCPFCKNRFIITKKWICCPLCKANLKGYKGVEK